MSPVFSVSDCIALINQTLEYAYPSVIVEGEVASYKVNKGQYVFFDIKDDGGSLGCFMTVYQLRVPLGEGMRVRVLAVPKLTAWGKFSLTVREAVPVGEGSLKKAFEALRAKLEGEGLFAPERKRSLPPMPAKIGVVSSTQAAGYADFVRILGERWGGVEVVVANTQVQGMGAPASMVRAIEHLNQLAEPPEVIVIIRGGGSADDLVAFNDEPLVRAVAASRAPTLVGVGHDTDTSLCDLAADLSAATPSNAAQLLVPHRDEVAASVQHQVRRMALAMQARLAACQQAVVTARQQLGSQLNSLIERQRSRLGELQAVLAQLDPRQALRRGYAIVREVSTGRLLRGLPSPGSRLSLETWRTIVTVGVIDVTEKTTDSQR